MNRLDELLSLVLDRVLLSRAEHEELERLLEEPGARERGIQLIEIETALRGREPLGEIAGPVLRRLREVLEGSVLADDVLTAIRNDPQVRWQPRRQSKIVWLWPALGTAAGLAAAAALLWARPTTQAAGMAPIQITHLSGQYHSVAISRGTDVVPAAEGVVLKHGDRLSVGAGGRGQIAFDSGRSRMEMEPGTRLAIAGTERAPTLLLREGAIALAVAPREPDAPLRVETEMASAIVRGTRFRIAETSVGTWLSVTEGRVDFTEKESGKRLAVGAGKFAVMAKGVDFIVRDLPQDGIPRIPLPIDFSKPATGGDADWQIKPGQVRQSKVSLLPAYAELKGFDTGVMSVCTFPIESASRVLLEATVSIDDTLPPQAPTRAAWGFGLGLRIGAGPYEFRGRSIQDPHLRVFTLSMGDKNITSLLSDPRMIEFSHDPSGEWKIRIAATRNTEGRSRIRAKMWPLGDPEPTEWQVDSIGPIVGEFTHVGVDITRLACTFREIQAWRIE